MEDPFFSKKFQIKPCVIIEIWAIEGFLKEILQKNAWNVRYFGL